MDCRLNLNVSLLTTPFKPSSPSTLAVLLGMAAPVFPPPPTAENDIYSMSDQQLSETYHFVEEIGFGNWGSVWLCRTKNVDLIVASVPEGRRTSKVAVKVVHRSKTSTTAARVKSLWNEMKIVRSFKHDPHPAIIPFHSFIITPSYALISMEYLPQLVPVEVAEWKAREWFHLLLSGILFLHERGVVHNDIKPANILLSSEQAPVLVDFGFAEKYDVGNDKPFLSNLAYGTPEYLSPERARGNLHDTRKSDVWSLGITFFEILVGRTPFEYTEGEQFSTKEDLERYWNRTVKGEWVGKWQMSKGIEKLLKRMVAPNADMRCNATQAMNDEYWTNLPVSSPPSKLPQHRPTALKPKDPNVPETKSVRVKHDKAHSRIQSAGNVRKANSNIPVLTSRDVQSPPKKHGRIASLGHALSPVKGSPSRPSASAAKENAPPVSRSFDSPRDSPRYNIPRKPVPQVGVDAAQADKKRSPKGKDKEQKEKNRKNRVLLDVGTKKTHANGADATKNGHHQQNQNSSPDSHRSKAKDKGKENDTSQSHDRSKDRVRDFQKLRELERERMREELEESDAQTEDWQSVRAPSMIPPSSAQAPAPPPKLPVYLPINNVSSPVLPSASTSKSVKELMQTASPGTPIMDEPKPSFSSEESANKSTESGLHVFKQSLKQSLDKTLRLYQSSTLGRKSKQSIPPTPSLLKSPDSSMRTPMRRRESWEDESMIRNIKSSLPVVRQAVRSEKVAADNRMDRMTIWIRNVEQVVKTAQEDFASSSIRPLPPLPVPPVSRSAEQTRAQRQSRLPRRVIPADQIFLSGREEHSMNASTFNTSTMQTEYLTATETSHDQSTILTIPTEQPSNMLTIPSEQPSTSSVTSSPPRARRATITTQSPQRPQLTLSINGEFDLSPRRREKSASSGNLNSLIRPISPMDRLQFELEQESSPKPMLPLTAVLDRSVFIVNSGSTPALHEMPSIPSMPNTTTRSPGGDSTLLSPPDNRKRTVSVLRNTTSVPSLNSPARRHVEGIYDRFLMATSGVKRVGRGYQSDNAGAVLNIPTVHNHKRSKFFSSRRAMPPPVSSEDIQHSSSFDELGMRPALSEAQPVRRSEEGKNTVQTVRKVFMALAHVNPISRRQLKHL